MKEDIKNKVSIHAAHEIDQQVLMEFYNKMYTGRVDLLQKKRDWVNVPGLGNEKMPLVFMFEGKVIAHLGKMPETNVMIDGEKHTASWFMDISVLPEYQRMGIGTMITRHCMNESDIYLGIGNDKSINAYKKFGWLEATHTYLHTFPVAPFSHPRFVRKFPAIVRSLLNIPAHMYTYTLYKKFAGKKAKAEFEPMDKKRLDGFLEHYKKAKSNFESDKAIVQVRDDKYVDWRVLKSPNADKYYIYDDGEIAALALPNNNHGKYIDILWISDLTKQEAIRKMIASMAIWGMKNGIAYLRLYTNDESLSSFLKHSLKSGLQKPRSVFVCKDPELLKQIADYKWNWQLLDCDFERL